MRGAGAPARIDRRRSSDGSINAALQHIQPVSYETTWADRDIIPIPVFGVYMRYIEYTGHGGRRLTQFFNKVESFRVDLNFTNKETIMAKKNFNPETKTWTFDSGIAVHELTVDELSEAMQLVGLGHGILQKTGDAYAGAAKDTADTEQSVEEYIDASIVDSLDRLRKGDWNLRTGGAGPRITDLVRAIAEAYEVDEDEAAEKVATFSADDKKGARAHPAIKPILDRLSAERAAKKATESAAAAEGVELPPMF